MSSVIDFQTNCPPQTSDDDFRASRRAGSIGQFERRHIGPDADEIAAMCRAIDVESIDALTDAVIPKEIAMDRPLAIDPARSETEVLAAMRELSGMNRVYRSCIGMGYHDTVTPPVIQRNVLENPGWYTQYTPYQAEISQGRLEALLNFQTMIADLTGLPLAGASLLDEATAAAEAMTMALAIGKSDRGTIFVADHCHPQTIDVVRTRAEFAGINVEVAPVQSFDPAATTQHGGEDPKPKYFAVLVQVPETDGRIVDHAALARRATDNGVIVIAAADIFSLVSIRPPGQWGADICVGSAQRFGVPMGLGGPHAAFLSTHTRHARKMPGRIIGVSKDAAGRPALRMAIQTREQHIRRDKATSNICTAQALLAVMASFYAAYHGREGLRRIADRTRRHTLALAAGLQRLGHQLVHDGPVLDTIRIAMGSGRHHAGRQIADAARERHINVREYDDGTLGVALDETADDSLVADLLAAFNFGHYTGFDLDELADQAERSGLGNLDDFARDDDFLTAAVFRDHRSETQMLRYIFALANKDLSLTHSMIPLGSCTMKLNATAEMMPLSWEGFSRMHPFAPDTQWRGYTRMFRMLESQLAAVTGLPAVSLQPNAGAQGEYTGLLVIRAYHEASAAADGRENRRDVCLIPTSAHGTNPASAVMAGMRVVGIACDAGGNIDLEDLRAKSQKHRDELSALMVTYPSTHGVFESTIARACQIVHQHGGQIYMDGANMNAQVGLTSPGLCGADVCHLNLHKTFCIPHGGGGPGMGPIAVAEHLADFLPGHPASRPDTAGRRSIGPVSAAPYGSASILTISQAYIALMGGEGLRRASQVAILNANYMATRLRDHYDILYTDAAGRVAHEFILDCRSFKKSAAVDVTDIAKRLMDYGFHSPTMSWPVAETLMVEPTESESKAEMDRFCEAMIAIRDEIRQIEDGRMDRDDNPLRHAPHPAIDVVQDDWPHGYSRELAAYPADWTRHNKFWPSVSRIDNTHGDRHLICTCGNVSDYDSQ